MQQKTLNVSPKREAHQKSVAFNTVVPMLFFQLLPGCRSTLRKEQNAHLNYR